MAAPSKRTKRERALLLVADPQTLAEVTPGTVVTIVGGKRPVRVGGEIKCTLTSRVLVTDVRDDGIEVGASWRALHATTKVTGVVSMRRTAAPIRYDVAELGERVADPLGGDGDGEAKREP
jgi:hypothetical protein